MFFEKRNKSNLLFKALLTFILVIVLVIIAMYLYVTNYTNPQNDELLLARIFEKQVQVGEVNFNYAEGPDNGPALVLLHAQLLDWYTYNKVLPELSTKFHIYAIDYPGHGGTVVPDNYIFSANQIGGDLEQFIIEVIREPVYVTGNSSGGLLTTWLAANASDYVKAIVLEDPPLFSSEYPEIKNTIAYKSFTTSNKAISSGYNESFIKFWISESTNFFKTYTKPGTQQLLGLMVSAFTNAHPTQPVELPFLPVSVQEMIRGLSQYNPAFGNAFYEGTWNEGFDHFEALSRITCPVLLIHANYTINEDGILDGAMSDVQAEQAIELIKNGRLVTIDSPHVVNLEKPEAFIHLLETFFLSENK